MTQNLELTQSSSQPVKLLGSGTIASPYKVQPAAPDGPTESRSDLLERRLHKVQREVRMLYRCLWEIERDVKAFISNQESE